MPTNTQILLKEGVTQEYKRTNLYPDISQFFEYFGVSQVLKNYELSDEEIDLGLVDGGGDGGCDAFYLFLNSSLLHFDQIADISAPRDSVLEICLFQIKDTNSFREDTIMKWKTLAENLLDLSHSINDYQGRYKEEILDAFQAFRDAHTRLISQRTKLKFRYFYITYATEIHPNVSQQGDELKNQTIRRFYPTADISIEFIGSERLFELFNKHAEDQMNLKLVETPISPDQKKNYVTLVKLSTYFRFIVENNGEIKKRLFEANVRDYQGNNNVNTCIARSLKEPDNEDFWWLNNGVTILASEANLASNKELAITNPEIVNGLQTSTEIYNYFSDNPDAIENDARTLLVRVIVPDTEESRNRIIFATNNQTGVHKSTLRVTDSIHLKIELFFRSRGLFYDRRKNHYKNQGKKPSEIVSITFLGQCLYTLALRKPDYARARPSNLLTDDDVYDQLYADDSNLNFFYKAALLGKMVEWNVKSIAEYTSTEKNDIKFYVLYGVMFVFVGKRSITQIDIIQMNTDRITIEYINQIREKVYDAYQQKRVQNPKIAKMPEFVDYIETILQ